MPRVVPSRDPNVYLQRRTGQQAPSSITVAKDEMHAHREPVEYYPCRLGNETPDEIRSK